MKRFALSTVTLIIFENFKELQQFLKSINFSRAYGLVLRLRYPWLLLPVLGLLTFAIAFISVYGFRDSLVSFSGPMALVLSIAHDSEELEIYQYTVLIGLGGLWNLLLSKVWYRINLKAETEEFLETLG